MKYHQKSSRGVPTLLRRTARLAVIPAVAMLYAPSSSMAQSLGTAENFAILDGNAVTCTRSTVNGDVGLDGSFSPTPPCTINGSLHNGDAAAQAGYTDFLSAYATLAATPACTATNVALAGATLTPGVYCYDAGVTVTNATLTLDGSCSDTWIFRIGTSGVGALTGTGFTVTMTNCVDSCSNNVFWWTADGATLTDSTFIGSILAGSDGTVTGPAGSVNGQILAGGEGTTLAPTGDITLTDALINHCPAVAPTPTPTVTSAPAPTVTGTPTPTATGTPTPTVTGVPAPTVTAGPAEVPTPTPTPTRTLQPTSTPTRTPTVRPTRTPTATPTPRTDEICRTPEFWKTHACGTDGVNCEDSRSQNITQQVISMTDAGCLEICGENITNTVVDSADSVLEGMCVRPKGNQKLKLVRQLIGAALNCVVSGDPTGTCAGMSVESDFQACNQGCATGDFGALSLEECIKRIDNFNTGRLNCCNLNPLTGEVDGQPFNFKPAGPAGSTKACVKAKRTACEVIDESEFGCATGTQSEEAETCSP